MKSRIVLLLVIAVLPDWVAANIELPFESHFENGDVVPIKAVFSPSMEAGDTLIVEVAGQQIVQFVVVERVEVKAFETRIRLLSSGAVNFRLQRANGEVELASKKVGVTIVGALVQGDATPMEPSLKSVVSGKVVKALYTHPMTQQDYIDEIVVELGDGKAIINPSPFVSKNPWFKITTEQPLSKANFAATTAHKMDVSLAAAVRPMPQTTGLSPKDGEGGRDAINQEVACDGPVIFRMVNLSFLAVIQCDDEYGLVGDVVEQVLGANENGFFTFSVPDPNQIYEVRGMIVEANNSTFGIPLLEVSSLRQK